VEPMPGLRSSQPSLSMPRVGIDRPRPRIDTGERARARVVLAPSAPAAEPELVEFGARAERDWPRRMLNVVISLLGITLTLPLMLLVALAIKLSSRGPVIYTQVRVGLDRRRLRGSEALNHRRTGDIGGKPFRIYKFRTMRVDAEQGTGAVWAKKDDDRVTRVGRFLRQYRMDELPQLFNVLKGEMNIVGPRPERPTIFAELRENITEYPLRQLAKPGITGLAQISQDYDTNLEDVRRKVHYDLEYIRRQGLLEDIRIMAKTIPVILFRKGGW